MGGIKSGRRNCWAVHINPEIGVEGICIQDSHSQLE